MALSCRREAPSPETAASADASLDTLDVDAAREPLRLYYPGRGGRLHVEERTVAVTDTREARLRAALDELFAGPSDPDLRPPFPASVGVADVLLSDDGIVYVDLVSADLPKPPPSGSLTEILTVYSVVNTVMANLHGLRGVVLLWNGEQPSTFAGHLDTSRPLRIKEDLVAGR